MTEHNKRFSYEKEESFGGPFHVYDSVKKEHICRTFDEAKAKHITKTLNVYNVMLNSGPGIHAMNRETLEVTESIPLPKKV